MSRHGPNLKSFEYNANDFNEVVKIIKNRYVNQFQNEQVYILE